MPMATALVAAKSSLQSAASKLHYNNVSTAAPSESTHDKPHEYHDLQHNMFGSPFKIDSCNRLIDRVASGARGACYK